MSFETKLKRIEEILSIIQDDKTEFENSVKLYEEAMVLIKDCYDILKSGKGKIQEITENFKLIDFKLD